MRQNWDLVILNQEVNSKWYKAIEFDTEFALTHWKGPWRSYALYWAPFFLKLYQTSLQKK